MHGLLLAVAAAPKVSVFGDGGLVAVILALGGALATALTQLYLARTRKKTTLLDSTAQAAQALAEASKQQVDSFRAQLEEMRADLADARARIDDLLRGKGECERRVAELQAEINELRGGVPGVGQERSAVTSDANGTHLRSA